MYKPEYIVRRAKSRENQNLRFRTWLKGHVNPDDLDEAFRELHEELFDGYDCCQCGNCCRMYRTTVEPAEMDRIAQALGMTVPELKEKYLIHDKSGVEVFPAPCPMLQEDGTCRIQDVKPEECRAFPYTDRPERMFSLYAVMEYAGICPVVFEIVERLKKRYHFT